MPLSLENPDQRKLIDHLVNGTLTKKVAEKIPGLIIESEFPLKLRYTKVKKTVPKLSQQQKLKNEQTRKKDNFTPN
jgi:hypothetical protein